MNEILPVDLENAEIAYTAYCKAIFVKSEGEVFLPTWEKQTAIAKHGWVAAVAVLRNLLEQQLIDKEEIDRQGLAVHY